MKKTVSFSLSIFYYQENTTWVAQCLEYDIVGHGKSLDDALDSFQRVFLGQLILDVKNNRNPLETTPKAPKECWDQFDMAKRLQDRKPFYFPEEMLPAYIIAATAADLRIVA